MLLLREYIRSILGEKRRLHDENRVQTEIDKLKLYVDKDLFFHMTDDYRLFGVNPHLGAFDTPVGIYTYPLTSAYFNKFMSSKLGFAQGRKYVVICKPKNINNLIFVSKYTIDDFKNDCIKLKTNPNKVIDKETIKNNPTSMLMRLIYNNNANNFILATKNLIKLGYDGIYDDTAEGVIHSLIPTQAFFVNSSVLTIIDVINNFIVSPKDKNFTKKFTLKDYMNKIPYELQKNILGKYAFANYIQYIDHPSEELLKIAIAANPGVLQLVQNQQHKS
jgi:hypothetical protein